MAKLSALVIWLSMCVPVVMMLYREPILFKNPGRTNLEEFVLLAGLNVAPYGVLLLVHHRSRSFPPGLVVAGLVAVGLATLHAYVIKDPPDAQGGLGYLFYLIFQLVAIVAPLGLGLELAHLVRRRHHKAEASGTGRSSVPEEGDSPQ